MVKSQTISTFTGPVIRAAVAPPVVFVVKVSATGASSVPLTGVVRFYDGTRVIADAPLVNGTATLSTSALAVGNHSITAVYQGDTNYAGSSAGPISQMVYSAAPAVRASRTAPHHPAAKKKTPPPPKHPAKKTPPATRQSIRRRWWSRRRRPHPDTAHRETSREPEDAVIGRPILALLCGNRGLCSRSGCGAVPLVLHPSCLLWWSCSPTSPADWPAAGRRLSAYRRRSHSPRSGRAGAIARRQRARLDCKSSNPSCWWRREE